MLISSSFKLVSPLSGQLATRSGGHQQYMQIHNEAAWVREAGGARGRGGEGKGWRGVKVCTKKNPAAPNYCLRNLATCSSSCGPYLESCTRNLDPGTQTIFQSLVYRHWGAQGVLVELHVADLLKLFDSLGLH